MIMLRLVCSSDMKSNLAVSSTEDSSARIRVAPPAKRAKRIPPTSKDLGVVGQIKLALLPKAVMATSMGFLLGGFVPLATFWLSHHELDASVPIYAQLVSYIVLGGLVYSAKTVYTWGTLAFQIPAKALGFVVLLEGVMILSRTSWLSFMALAYLICINGIATGCNLALPPVKSEDA